MDNEALREKLEKEARFTQLTTEVENMARGIAEMMLDRTKNVARTDAERVGLISASVVSALQLIDGGAFRRPGATSAALDALLKWQTDVMRRHAQRQAAARGDRPGPVPSASPPRPRPPTENIDEKQTYRDADGVEWEQTPERTWVPAAPTKDQPEDDPLVMESGTVMRRSEQEALLFGDPRYEPGSGGILGPPKPITATGQREREMAIAQHRAANIGHGDWPQPGPHTHSVTCDHCSRPLPLGWTCSCCTTSPNNAGHTNSISPIGEAGNVPHVFAPKANGEIGECLCGRDIAHWMHKTAQVTR